MVRLKCLLMPMLIGFTAGGIAAAQMNLVPDGDLRWYKGVTHFHTLWSDGDAPPEWAVAWYADHAYDFIGISDHNILPEGDRWFPVSDVSNSRLTPEKVRLLRERFGEDWVEIQEVAGQDLMRLKTMNELIEHFTIPGERLLIMGEEVTAPMAVHINAINIAGLIEPVSGETVEDTLKRNLDVIDQHGRDHGLEVLAHINHPNWSTAITAEEIVSVGGERFFEVYNGHGGVRNWGDEGLHIVSTDRLWDIILTLRFAEGDTDRPMYGVATDDSHEWYDVRASTPPGRGWVMVLADELDADTLVASMKDGAFYSSSGVTIDTIEVDNKAYRVSMQPESGVTYTTQFIGTPKGASTESEPVRDEDGNEIRATRLYSDEIGKVLYETTDNPAVYTITGGEIYVRAKVISSKPKEFPFREGDREMAWTQPVKID